MGNDRADVLAASMCHQPPPCTLTLADNNLNGGAIARLLRATSLVRLTTLDLSHNAIGAGSNARVLASAVATAHGLRSLTLRSTAMSDGAVAQVVEAVNRSCPNLKRLSLRKNRVGVAGAVALARWFGWCASCSSRAGPV
jgi:hypothetical protein